MTVTASPGATTGQSAPREGLPPSLLRRVCGARDRVVALKGWRRRGVAMLAGALSVLALAPFFLWPVLALTLPALVWLIDGDGGVDRSTGVASSAWSRQALLAAAGAGWWFGFGYFLAGLFWVGEAFLVEAEVFAWLLPFAVTLLPAGLALFFAAATTAARLRWGCDAWRVVTLAVALGATEWLRGHILTGFPWNVLGYALTMPLPLMQWARWVGIYSLTVVTVALLALPLVVAAGAATAGGDWRRAVRPALLTPLVLALMFGLGWAALASGEAGDVDGVRLRLVQPSVPQREKWQRDKQREIFDLHLGLSRTDPSGKVDDMAGITHVVWPEAAMPFLPLETPEALREIGEMLRPGQVLLTGALRVERHESPGTASNRSVPDNSRGLEVFNSLIAFGSGGKPLAVYDKLKLVPFGEFLPMQPVLEAIGLRQLTRMRGGFTEGVRPRPLLGVPGLPPVIGLVCYEALFPDEVVQGSQRPGVIVNVTNDGWFGNTTGPRQHLHQARVRAVEEGVPIIRVANNGITALIDSHGRIRARLNLNVRGTLDVQLPKAVVGSMIGWYRDCFFVMLSVLALLNIEILRRHRNSNCSANS